MPKTDSVDVFPHITWGCMCSLLNKDANLSDSEFREAEDGPFFSRSAAFQDELVKLFFSFNVC